MQVLFCGSRVTVANIIFPTNSICLMVEKIYKMIYNFYLSSQSLNLTSTLLKVRESIRKTTLMVMFVGINVYSKKSDFPYLPSIRNKKMTIPQIPNLLALIFWPATSVLEMQKLYFSTKLAISHWFCYLNR